MPLLHGCFNLNSHERDFGLQTKLMSPHPLSKTFSLTLIKSCNAYLLCQIFEPVSFGFPVLSRGFAQQSSHWLKSVCTVSPHFNQDSSTQFLVRAACVRFHGSKCPLLTVFSSSLSSSLSSSFFLPGYFSPRRG